MKQLFEGLRVLDCASFIAAPAAATILGDFGADVIKLEPPQGDPYRAVSSKKWQPQSADNYGWMLDSRNKRSIAVDLSTSSGTKVLSKLLETADVFITNYPLAARKRLSVDYEHLASRYPKLIYASFTGYGERGAESEKPGFDVTAYWARSGLMDAVRPQSGSTPARPVPGMGDHPSAVALFAGIVMALYKRQMTGHGTEVSTSLLANGVWANSFFAQAAMCEASFRAPPPRESAVHALGNLYKTSDGMWLILSIHDPVRQWAAFVAAVDCPDLLNDSRFATHQGRLDNSSELISILDEAFSRRSRAEWRARLDEHGIIFDIVSTMDDVVHDQQLKDNDILVPFADSSTLTVTAPIKMRCEEVRKPIAAPALGQHSDEILKELGFVQAEIAEMRQSNAIK